MAVTQHSLGYPGNHIHASREPLRRNEMEIANVEAAEIVKKKIIINGSCLLDVFVLLFQKMWVFLGAREE